RRNSGFITSAKCASTTKYVQAQIAYYDHAMAMWKISELLYQWQQKASNVVMSLVCIVVLAGISFSGLQLWKAVTSGGPQDKTELEISANRVRLTSSVVGIAVLAISL